MQFYLAPYILANLQTIKFKASKSLLLKLEVLNATLEVSILLDDLPQLIGKKRLAQANLANLQHTLNIALKTFLYKIKLKEKIVLKNISINNNVIFDKIITIDNKINFYKFTIYLENDSKIIFNYLSILHRKYMLTYSLIFNEKMKFPINLGETLLMKDDIHQLKEGTIIFLDKFYIKNNLLRCKIDKLQIDIDLKN